MLKVNLQALRKPKVIYPAIIALVITSIAFYLLKEKEKILRVHIQNQLTQTIEEKQKVENKLIETVKTKEAIEAELTTEKEKTVTLEKELEDKEQKIKIALDRLEREIAARKKAEAQLMIALKGKENLEKRLSNFSRKSETIELEKIVIKPGSIATGKIIMVSKDYAFAVVNLGIQHNIKVGDILYVYRNNEFIGELRVERAEEKMSAAHILPDWQNVEFKKEDTVKTI